VVEAWSASREEGLPNKALPNKDFMNSRRVSSMVNPENITFAGIQRPR